MSWRASKWAMTQTVGSSSAKSVLFVLAEAADEKGETLIGNETIAKRTELSLRTVVTAIQLLIERGAIIRKRRNRGMNRTSDYTRITFSQGANAALTEDAAIALTEDANAAPSEDQRPAEGAPESQGANAALWPRKVQPLHFAEGATDDIAKVQPLHRITPEEPPVSLLPSARDASALENDWPEAASSDGSSC